MNIPQDETESALGEPFWINRWMPGLDAVTLYGLLASYRPQKYFEIGSGSSTRFARRAIVDQGLPTTITSIDPSPRNEIDTICDRVIRERVEYLDLSLFDELSAGDILFVDNSHRVSMNSDSSVVFLDILPRLKSGVIIGFHDIMLPSDYPVQWKYRYYSEQYVLAAYLLAEGNRSDILLANAFIHNDPELSLILAPLWSDKRLAGVSSFGSSFWLKMK